MLSLPRLTEGCWLRVAMEEQGGSYRRQAWLKARWVLMKSCSTKNVAYIKILIYYRLNN
jgi:hypothetical protein